MAEPLLQGVPVYTFLLSNVGIILNGTTPHVSHKFALFWQRERKFERKNSAKFGREAQPVFNLAKTLHFCYQNQLFLALNFLRLMYFSSKFTKMCQKIVIYNKHLSLTTWIIN